MRPFSVLCRSFHSAIRRCQVMETKILTVNPANYRFEAAEGDFPEQNATSVIDSQSDQEAIQEAVKQLKAGQAIGVPTETVYGLAANALSSGAVAKIFAAKNRPQDNPLIVHVSSLAMFKSLLPNGEIPPAYVPVIRACWPGALTLIVPASDRIPSEVTAGQQTVAVRFPSHPVARALIEACGFPLAAPSANASGRPSPTLAEHVRHDLSGRIPLILDGGACNVGVESTVLDALRTPPAILRPGGVTYENLRTLPGMESLQVYSKHFVDRALEEAPTTPGMKYRHYSPDAKVVLMEQTTKNVTQNACERFDGRWREELQNLSSAVAIRKVGILKTVPDDSPEQLEQKMWKDDRGTEYISYQMGRHSHPEEVARGMFTGLRALDLCKVDVIFVQGIPETKEGLAVMNRLRKAASTTIEI